MAFSTLTTILELPRYVTPLSVSNLSVLKATRSGSLIFTVAVTELGAPILDAPLPAIKVTSAPGLKLTAFPPIPSQLNSIFACEFLSYIVGPLAPSCLINVAVPLKLILLANIPAMRKLDPVITSKWTLEPLARSIFPRAKAFSSCGMIRTLSTLADILTAAFSLTIKLLYKAPSNLMLYSVLPIFSIVKLALLPTVTVLLFDDETAVSSHMSISVALLSNTTLALSATLIALETYKAVVLSPTGVIWLNISVLCNWPSTSYDLTLFKVVFPTKFNVLTPASVLLHTNVPP